MCSLVCIGDSVRIESTDDKKKENIVFFFFCFFSTSEYMYSKGKNLISTTK